MVRLLAAFVVCFALLSRGEAAEAQGELLAGFAAVDITPKLGAGRVYLAGYGMNRRASGVHDSLMARAVVLKHGNDRIAIVGVDLVGLQYPQVKAIRAKLPLFRYVLVASTHNHQGPDVIGIWGRGPFHRGADDAYLDEVVERVVQSVNEAAERVTPVTAAYGLAEDDSLLADSRLPVVKDGVLRMVRFDRIEGAAPSQTPKRSFEGGRSQAELGNEALPAEGAAAGLIVQWNCHPESVGPQNHEITADFPWATIAALEKRHGCPVVYVSGAVGGLMSHPPRRVFDDGKELAAGTFEYARRYGKAVADLANRALEKTESLELTPFVVSTKPIGVPVHNSLYRTARALRVMKREGYLWTGDFEALGEQLTDETADRTSAVESEVAYLRLGDLHVACIPGELYPELVYGKYQEPSEPAVDYPDAPLEPTIASLMPGSKWLLVGLANDELGYIIPKRQWDKAPPYAYGKQTAQYGEVNSCGPEVAPIVMKALQLRVAEGKGAGNRE